MVSDLVVGLWLIAASQVGNQIDKGRDPVTLSLSKDGVVFDRHWSVRHGVEGADIDHGGSCPRL